MTSFSKPTIEFASSLQRFIVRKVSVTFLDSFWKVLTKKLRFLARARLKIIQKTESTKMAPFG